MTCRDRMHFHDVAGWDEARDRWLAPTAPGETPTAALLRRLDAIRDMERLETSAVQGGAHV